MISDTKVIALQNKIINLRISYNELELKKDKVKGVVTENTKHNLKLQKKQDKINIKIEELTHKLRELTNYNSTSKKGRII